MFQSKFCICRLCLNECFTNIVSVNSGIKNMLNICAPEIDLNITVEDPEICFNCYTQLKNAYEFKKSILNIEEKLYRFTEPKGIKCAKISLKKYVFENRKAKNNFIKNEINVNEFSPKLDDKDLIDIVENPIKVENLTCEEISKEIDTKLTKNLGDTNVLSEFVDFIENKTQNNASKYDKREYTCNKCEYKAARYDLLKKHSIKCKLDAKPKTFKCKHCSYSSIRKRNVTRHEYQHLGEKPYKCDICGKTFVEKFILRDHIYRHMGKAPFSFKCCECDKEFIRKCDLNSHLVLKHPDYRPFICKVCQRGFVDRNSCRLHAKKHHLHSKK